MPTRKPRPRRPQPPPKPEPFESATAVVDVCPACLASAEVCAHHGRAGVISVSFEYLGQEYARRRANGMEPFGAPSAPPPPAPEASKVPAYYLGKSGAPAWDAIEDYGLNYNRGCVLKYLVRAGRKNDDPRQDLRKAIHCLEREIELFERSVIDDPGHAA